MDIARTRWPSLYLIQPFAPVLSRCRWRERFLQERDLRLQSTVPEDGASVCPERNSTFKPVLTAIKEFGQFPAAEMRHDNIGDQQVILLDRSAISRIENESRYVLDYEAAAIAKALKVSVGSFFGEKPKQ